MKLYFSPGACSLSPHILAHEIGIHPELVKVDLKAGTYAGGDFKKINPKGYVPALQLDDGSVLTENAAISPYLADQKPEANLIPRPGTMDRYRSMEWMAFLSTEVHKSFGPIFKGAGEDEQAKAVDTLGKRLGFIDERLAGKQFLFGDRLDVSDIYLYVMTRWLSKTKLDINVFPNLAAWKKRMDERPAVKAALKHEEQT